MFIHLRTHTEFSIVDGTNRINEIIDAAVSDGQPALAITDLGNLFGAVKFYKTARGKGVKPIIGADVWLERKDAVSTPVRLLLLVQSHQGYLNLCELITRAWTKNAATGQAIVKMEWLQELNEGLIALSGAQGGAIGQALLKNDAISARECALQLVSIFPNRLYIELQRAGRADDARYVLAAVQFAEQMRLPVVATHPVQFLTEDDYEAHEARVCIADGEILGNAKRERKFTSDQYFKSVAEMTELFADVPSALTNTLEIAKRCSLTLELGKSQLPNFPTPEVNGTRMSPEDYFRQVSFKGLEERLVRLYPENDVRDAKRPEYVARLEFEINTILKMGFPGYFLIVSDFIKWAKANQCPVGPGRGSGAGSLVAYALRITDLDPLRYNLLFERFLNPERVSMPDFDIDFCQTNRDRVIDYVKNKYGHEAVSQIVTFGTMAARAVIRDVGRVLDFPYGFCDGISKLIPNKPGQAVTLRLRPPGGGDKKIVYVMEAEPILAERERTEEDVKLLLELARKLEGITRNVGMHAGGVLIAPGKLTDFCPLYQQPGSGSAVSQFDKDDVEAAGLVKFDFLGLATLTILEIAREFIARNHAGQENFSFDDIALNDEPTFTLFQDGKTESVFQFESSGMQRMLKDAKPTRLEDLIALNALYRPGPMDLIPSFVARKHEREVVEYPHPLVESVLSETYGIMVYQEQVMQTAQVLGGYSLGSADMLRRAMGKKKPEEMAEHRITFRTGAAKNQIGEKQADEIFDLMEKFASYGFNKSHAAAYSLLAYQTAWLKVHYTAEFFAANMTVEMGDTDKLKVLHGDGGKFGIRFESPDVNSSLYRFEPIDKKVVRYGLGAIKGAGQQAIDAIVLARQEGGPFTSLFDFCVRVDRSRINKRTVDALIKAGAFDKIGTHRAALLASVETAFAFALSVKSNVNQGGLFEMFESDASSTQEPPLVETPVFSLNEKLAHEKTAIGFYLSGHLFHEVEPEIRKFARFSIEDANASRDVQILAGIVNDLRIINGMRGKLVLFNLDDGSGTLECSVDENIFNAHRDLLKDDELVILDGRLQAVSERYSRRFKVEKVQGLETSRQKFGKFMRISIDKEMLDLSRLSNFKAQPSALAGDNNGLGVRVSIKKPGVKVELQLGSMVRVIPNDAAMSDWKVQAGGGLVEVVY